jgi:hypothetical protein
LQQQQQACCQTLWLISQNMNFLHTGIHRIIHRSKAAPWSILPIEKGGPKASSSSERADGYCVGGFAVVWGVVGVCGVVAVGLG